MPILDQRDIDVTNSQSILAFATTGGGNWPVWDRFLHIDGKPAYHIGNVCGTCAFFFERLEGAQRISNPLYSIAQLNAGLLTIDDAVLEATKAIMPDGAYAVILHEIRPALTEPNEPQDYFSHEQAQMWGIDPMSGAPHHPKTSYYRLKSGAAEASAMFFEFLIPMFPQTWLNETRVDDYKSAIIGDRQPTVLTLSVFDHKEPQDIGENGFQSHACLAHYIVDGHHKAYAAAALNTPITALSFVALDQGVSTPADARKCAITICDAGHSRG